MIPLDAQGSILGTLDRLISAAAESSQAAARADAGRRIRATCKRNVKATEAAERRRWAACVALWRRTLDLDATEAQRGSLTPAEDEDRAYAVRDYVRASRAIEWLRADLDYKRGEWSAACAGVDALERALDDAQRAELAIRAELDSAINEAIRTGIGD